MEGPPITWQVQLTYFRLLPISTNSVQKTIGKQTEMVRKLPRIIIAIDGYSSCGKSSFAKAIATKLGYIYIDTGAMYRAVTWYCIEKNLIPANQPDVKRIIQLLPEINISFQRNENLDRNEIYLNHQNIEE